MTKFNKTIYDFATFDFFNEELHFSYVANITAGNDTSEKINDYFGDAGYNSRLIIFNLGSQFVFIMASILWYPFVLLCLRYVVIMPRFLKDFFRN